MGVLVGDAASGTSIIWAACQARYVYPFASLNIHGARKQGESWTTQYAKADYETGRWLDKQAADIYAAASDRDAAWWLDWMSAGHGACVLISADDLIELGMALPIEERRSSGTQIPMQALRSDVDQNHAPEAPHEQQKKLRPLNAKQRAFVQEYLKSWNATEAARQAGYSEKSIRSIASENLTKPNIKAAIEARIAELTMQADEVLIRLTEQARGIDSRYFVPGKGALDRQVEIDFDQLIADGFGHLIKALSYSKDGELTRVEFYDAQAALVQIGRHYKLFTDNVDLTSGGKRIEVAEIRVHEPEQLNTP